MASKIKTLLKEPFVHFVLLGAVLFAGHAVWSGLQVEPNTLTVETAEMERQALIFAGENRREPTDDDLKALLFSYIEEEVLVREALNRGLDTGDTIIRRRLAQKMRFLIEDVTQVEPPSDKVLNDWFETRKSEFAEPEYLSFTHIYLSPEKRGDEVLNEAETMFAGLSESGTRPLDPENMLTLGDPFMLKKTFFQVRESDIKNLFGEVFATTLFKNAAQSAQTGTEWQGIIPSPFGAHIVQIESYTPTKSVELNSVKSRVLREWIEQETRAQNQKALKTLIQKYTVDVEGAD